ncbi:MAG: 50S ribosomal protein L18e [Nanoarchaeota archaeon]|nr:50S ribosomal protein L18e [Nanoarchaeota archaeon]
MAKRTGPTNVQLKGLIQLLKKQSSEQKVGIWKRVALDLESPSRNRRVVNVYRINKHTKDNETVVVPGKILGTGEIDHKVNVAAFDFSEGARMKIMQAKGTCMNIAEMLQKNPKGQKIRIIG